MDDRSGGDRARALPDAQSPSPSPARGATTDGLDDLRAALAPTYVIERELGRGALATVYLAHDRKHDRYVALKVLKAIAVKSDIAERFLREIKLTARLSHPHIVPLLDSGEALGLPFYVMPNIPGESLRERLARETCLPVDAAIHLTLEVADALAYAHAQGIIHRDIKPGNIMLAGRHALVADFGIAKAITSIAPGEDQTEAGVVVGTVNYMSPEQAMGDRLIDSRSDIYSLGAVLYEMLVGERAHVGETAQAVMTTRFTTTAPSARASRPEVSEEIDRVLRRALAPLRDDRFATAGEFEESLTAASHGGGRLSVAIRTSGQPHTVPSLAVLPFENLTDDPENEFLSDGIADEILTMLSRRRTIRVCARMSSFAFKKKQDDVRLIGAQLGVRHILLGTIRREANRLRITVQLVNARDGFQVWSERYDRTLADVFAMQDEIGSAIVAALNATLLDEELPAPSPPQQPAFKVYETFLRGRFFWNRRTEEGTRRAIESFEDAIALDAGYAPAHAGLADAWITLAVYGASSPNEAMPTARRFAETSLTLDPALAEARSALAQVLALYEWDWPAAEQAFRAAIALNPLYPAAHQGLASACLAPQGRFDEALAETRKALELDPLSLVLRVTLSGVLLYARQFEESVAVARQALELDAAFAPALFSHSQSLAQLGELDAAIENAERAVEFSGQSGECLGALGHALAIAGYDERADALRRTLEMRAARRYVSPAHIAQIDIGLGQYASALARLEQAVAVRATDLAWLGVRPSYDALREDPRFSALLHQLQLVKPGR